MTNLYAAYIVTWVIIGGYLVYVWRRHEAVKREETDLKR
jgi:CcmD family protein